MKVNKQLINETLKTGYYLIREHPNLDFSVYWFMYHYNSKVKKFILVGSSLKVVSELFEDINIHKKGKISGSYNYDLKEMKENYFLDDNLKEYFTAYSINCTYKEFILEHPEVLV